jgi:hypothetical protein
MPGNTQLIPAQIDVHIRIAKVKQGHVAFSRTCTISDPRADVISVEGLVSPAAVLVDLKDFLIRD